MHRVLSSKQFLEHDVRSFLREKARPWRAALRYIFVGSGATLLVLGLFYTLNFASFQRVNQLTTPIVAAIAAPTTQPLEIPAVIASEPTPAPTPAISSLPDNTLVFSDLGISAPIGWDTPLDEKTSLAKLIDGVIHLVGTAKPGQTGTVAIAGHSSNYAWAKGSYNNIFAPLQKAKAGEQISTVYKNIEYVYSIDRIYVVAPNDVQMLSATPGKNLLLLITCTPIGTSKNRLIVEAHQISPDPSTNQAYNQGQIKGQIPAAQ